MALPYDDTEYTQVIRLNANANFETFKAPGYVFVASSRPVAERQYVREMTLARGRLLYEVWDHWDECNFGYICPEHVYAEARRHRLTSAPNLWPEESVQTRQGLQRMYNHVKHHYPRAPHVAVKGAAETLYLQLYGRAATRIDVERAVCRYVQYYWTSFEFRVRSMRQNEEEVKKMVKPRMRELLWSWLEHGTRASEVVALWERNGLLDACGERGQFSYGAKRFSKGSPKTVSIRDNPILPIRLSTNFTAQMPTALVPAQSVTTETPDISGSTGDVPSDEDGLPLDPRGADESKYD
ncbi:hypothetical protein D0860_01425 [Hortaea werneckii]|uniref:Uncharacterized protein n=1 Tax=Hortaea werneckii TaxID=91943 RepID=A0A3M7HQZ8_HORWE|nr:hypothetical protein D0860_01425 [Hortaea werneckii]